MFLLFLFTSKFCYHSERESSCDGGVRERDVDLEKTYRYHAVTLGVLTVVFITTTLVTIKEQNGNFFLVRLCFLSFLFSFFIFISAFYDLLFIFCLLMSHQSFFTPSSSSYLYSIVARLLISVLICYLILYCFFCITSVIYFPPSSSRYP